MSAAEIRRLVVQAEEMPLATDPAAPLETARTFLRREKPTLRYHQGVFYEWCGSYYQEAEEQTLRAQLYNFLERCVVAAGNDRARPFKPTMARVTQILDALRAASNLPGSIVAPAWLAPAPDLAPGDIIACANGLPHLPTRSLLPHTSDFFVHNALDFDFSAATPLPAQWLRFLGDLWSHDPDSIDTLQEIFGYCLTPDTRQQKAFLIVGPKRSGKGTIGRIMRGLIGADNTIAPTLAGLGMNFGLAPLIGKRLAIISDARLGARADQHAIAERLLSVTGEDTVTIDRKFRAAWTGHLQSRFVILSNELPRLADASGALPSRFIVLTMTRSFYGQEDFGLTARLLLELPGILNWALGGLDRLRKRGYFMQPASAADAVQEIEDLGSPISAFIRDRCDVGTQYSVVIDDLFNSWAEWGKTQGRDHPGTAQTFGRDLRAAVPDLKTMKPHAAKRLYRGIGLRWNA